MKLTVINTGSKSNCYVLQNENEALFIECGRHYAEAMKAIAHNRRKVVGCIVSHEHGDHARYVNEYLNAVIPVAMTQGTWDALKENGKINSPFMPVICRHRETMYCGNFEITPFDVHHDAAEPVGYYIWHPECGSIIFATDTDRLADRFDAPSHIMLECNYDTDTLMANRKLPQETKDRIINSHMSLYHCAETLKAMDLTQCRNIVLIHLSDDNSREDMFIDTVRKATGKKVVAAHQGDIIDFDKTPF